MPTRLTGISLLLNNEQQEQIQDKAKNCEPILFFSRGFVHISRLRGFLPAKKRLIAALVTKKKLVTLTFSFNEGLICENQ